MKTILIIEDQPDILLITKEFLEMENFHVLTATNGLEAMKLLEDSLPNLILLDMKMPIMNGWEFSEAFLAKYGQGAPILVMTAAADAEKRARDISAAGWIEKPFNLDELIDKIKRHIT